MGSGHDTSSPITKGPRRLPFSNVMSAGKPYSPSHQRSLEEDFTLDEETDSETSKKLVHRWHDKYSILSTCSFPNRGLLFCGTQNHEILVFDIVNFERKFVLKGHTGSVLCLTRSKDEKFLFSGGSDSLVKVWDISTLKETHTIYSVVDIGDIFSISWSSKSNTIFFGCQNASILYIQLLDTIPSGDPNSLPSQRFDKFFDSQGPTGKACPKTETDYMKTRLIEVPSQNILRYAHNGFVYSMLIKDDLLISGGGDGLVNIWDLSNGFKLKRSLDNDDSVLSLAKWDSFLYCGLTNGQLKLWDLSTYQQIRTFSTKEGSDIMALAVSHSCIYKGTKNIITKCKIGQDSRDEWYVHDGLVLCAEICVKGKKVYLITGGNDASVAIWDVTEDNIHPRRASLNVIDNDSLLNTLSDIVCFKTVSKNPQLYIDESRRCAIYLWNLFKNFGADTELIPIEDGNPIVYACFRGKNEESDKPRILWYGHYDVIEADDTAGWKTNPFKLTAHDGYLFARGVSDNKGPSLASIFAVAELLQQGLLEADIVFLIEGEEECGSFGFQSAIKKYKNLIGDIDAVLLSNSYWLDEDTPCINYGLRGVLSVVVEVSSEGPDRHSGVDGGASREPTIDLINLLSKLTNDEGKVLLPNFYEPIKPLTSAEEKLYLDITKRATINVDTPTLLSKWKYPSLTIHKIEVSGPGNNTVIPRASKASLSFRIVPEQNMNVIKETLIQYCEKSFEKFNTENKLTVKIIHEAEPWLGDPSNITFNILHKAIFKQWGKEPLYIREGGSIPSVRFLEKIFNAPAAQIPCGQSSDNAHLDNEKLRVTNLYALKEILKDVFCQFPKQA